MSEPYEPKITPAWVSMYDGSAYPETDGAADGYIVQGVPMVGDRVVLETTEVGTVEGVVPFLLVSVDDSEGRKVLRQCQLVRPAPEPYGKEEALKTLRLVAANAGNLRYYNGDDEAWHNLIAGVDDLRAWIEAQGDR